jgi:type I restriction enzyme R subunit
MRMQISSPRTASTSCASPATNEEGKAELDNFIFPESRYPVIATTSKLMTTGVDAQTCKLIVLDQRIQSMTEFKQIIGRGTRINEDYDKYYFTIMDFKKATELFADPDFDGPPEQIYEPSGDDPPVPPDRPPGDDDIPPGETPPGPPFPPQPAGEKRIKYVVGGEVTVYVVAERVQYYGPDGKLITESLKDYTRKAVRREYASVDDFLRRWTGAERKKAVIDELETQGVLLEALAEEVGKKQSKAFDPFDLICHVAFDRPPLSRKERAEQLRKRDVFARYGAQARAVLDALLVKYADTGIESIEDIKILTLDPFSRLGTAPELVAAFGGKSGYLKAVQELEQQLYA